jgi:mannosyl-3-phosphoglycerate phosphatase
MFLLYLYPLFAARKQIMTKTIIFTDLDGSLLHPKTYSFKEAAPALELIRARGIPLVLCSSKTRAELDLYQKRLHITDPFIVENGGAVFVRMGYFTFFTNGVRRGDYLVSAFGTPYAEIRKAFVRLRGRLGVAVKGFGDMTVEDIAKLTGLPEEEAALAKVRDFAEPFIFEQGTDERVLGAIEKSGLHWTQGRLFCLMGNHDKGKAVRLLKRWYESEYGRIISIGIGDALNDLPLLREVDHPVLVQNADGGYDQRVNFAGVIKAKGIGPTGWNRALLELLQR